MNELKLFGNKVRPLKPIRAKPLGIKPERLIKTALGVVLTGALIGIGVKAYKEASS
jgi:hypothetical protein